MKNKINSVVTVLLFALVSQAWSQTYSVTDLGPLNPAAINNLGQVVGDYNGRAFIWTKFGGTRDLGTLPGGTFSRATAINDLGLVVGNADSQPVICDGFLSQQFPGFVWSRATGMQPIGSVPRGGFSACVFITSPTDVNDSGHIVGSTGKISTTYIDGFELTTATPMILFAGPYQANTNGINNWGAIVGQTRVSDSPSITQAALWNNDLLTDLGSLGGNPNDWSFCSAANSINDLGQVVGWSSTLSVCYPDLISGGFVHAFLWTQGAGMQDLGTLPGDTSSMARKINSFGQVIGASGTALSWDGLDRLDLAGRPFLWTQQNGMRDLNTLIPANSGWVLGSARGINIWGQIVGSGARNGRPHGFLLTPRTLFGF